MVAELPRHLVERAALIAVAALIALVMAGSSNASAPDPLVKIYGKPSMTLTRDVKGLRFHCRYWNYYWKRDLLVRSISDCQLVGQTPPANHSKHPKTPAPLSS